MRSLASIKTVSEIFPIEGKDRIVLAMIDGWSVIVKKGEFNVGDKCVYIEIDSVLPEREEFEFLRKGGFRIKTMKMAGVISQGICFPLSILPEKKNGEYEVNEDVTDVLGVKQYERTMDKEPTEQKPAPNKKYPQFLMRMAWFRKLVLPKKKSKGFPNFISKTDETRIQNMPFILQDKREWIATEKVDGQSGTFCLVRHKSRVLFVVFHQKQWVNRLKALFSVLAAEDNPLSERGTKHTFAVSIIQNLVHSIRKNIICSNNRNKVKTVLIANTFCR